MGEYESIFEQRGDAYDRAMRQFPHARDSEFENVLVDVDFTHVSKVLDVPSGGCYLSPFLRGEPEVVSIEPCKEFQATQHTIQDMGLEDLALPVKEFDLVVCLAAIHHVKNKPEFFHNVEKSLKPGGYLAIGDVIDSSGIAWFLDNFAGKYNGTGHNGEYISTSMINELAEKSGLSVVNCELRDCPWVFKTEQEMLEFCRLLFGLHVEDEPLKHALAEHIGFESAAGTTRLNWQLLYATLQKD